MQRLRRKSLDQTGYLMYLIGEVLAAPPYGFAVGNRRDEARRGGHIALEHREAIQICKALKARGVIPDFRFPNVIRLAPIPLYTTYAELWQTVQVLRDIVDSAEHRRYSAERGTVA